MIGYELRIIREMSDQRSRKMWKAKVIKAEDVVFEGSADDTMFLPKDTQMHYESTGKAKPLYIVNPEGNVRWRFLVGSD